MNRRLHLGRLFGIEVCVDWSCILTSVLTAAAVMTLERRLWPDLTTIEVVMAGSLATAGLFASLGAHEIVRVLAARRAGVRALRLTLFVLGGVSDVERSPATPRTEALGALAAPLFSLLVALVLGLGLAIGTAPLPRDPHDIDRLGLPGVVLAEIAAANLLVALVNLLPAYPLDGGRLLRAALWRASGDVDRATKYSAWTGQVVGFSLVIAGVALTLAGPRGAGMICAFVGWFVASASAQGYERVSRQRGS